MNSSESSEPRTETALLEQTAGAPASAERAVKGKTLLVVDDEVVLRELEAQVLSANGFHVLQSGSVAEALEVAAGTTPIHLLLTDFSLPDRDGLELARRFRQLHPQTPIILVSGSVVGLDNLDDDLERFAVMEKPFAFDHLLRMVGTLLANEQS